MLSSNENAVLDAVEFDEEELSIEDLEASLEAELALQMSELSFLEEEKEKIGNPDNLGKVILDEVWTQFGNQIGLDMTNETLIQEYNRTHKDESPEYNKKEGAKILNDPKYKETRAEMKRHQAEGSLKDGYTGKDLKPGDDFDVEHIVKRKEIFENQRRKQAGLEAAELANKDENMTAVNDSLNRSIKEKSNKEYVEKREQREKDLIAQNERAKKKIDESNMSDVEKRLAKEEADRRLQNKLDADDDLMLEADAKARKAINKDITKGAVKQTAKKAGKDALKAMAVAALFDLLKSIMNGLVRFFKEKHKSFKIFLSEMKEAIKRFISHISSFFRTGVSSVIGTVLSEVFGPIVSMFKKLASFIKQGVSSLVEAVHYLTAKENKNKPLSIKIAQVGKIVVAGITAAGAIVGGELIEKALLQIPFMATEIPLLGSLANVTGMFLASLLCGVVGAIVINRIDQYIAKQQHNENLGNQIEKKNEILLTQDKLMDAKIRKLEDIKEHTISSMMESREQAKDIIGEAMSTIYREEKVGEDNTDRLSGTKGELAMLLD